MRKKSKVTALDVAKAAGVSRHTVSRVLNCDRDVTPETVRKVKNAMTLTGYESDKRRTGPKTKKTQGIHTGTIVFLSLRQANPETLFSLPNFPALLKGIQGGLDEHDLNLTFAHAPDAASVPPVLNRREADGVLIFGHDDLDSPKGALKSTLNRIPTVWTFRGPADPGKRFDHVFFDNSYVGETAAEYFIKRGHDKVAVLNIAYKNTALLQRRDVFAAHAARRGIKADMVVQEPSSESLMILALNLIDKLLALSPRPTGIFCVTDNLLLSVFHALHKRGIEPGKDIELLGCNNDPDCMSQMHPRPATIDLNLSIVGEKAVEQLLRRMARPGEKSRSETFIQPELMPGEEVGSQRSEAEGRESEVGEMVLS